MKSLYRDLCHNEPTIPLFSQPWWLDALVGDAWDVALVKKGEEIVASMPYVIKHRYRLTYLSMPPLTQHIGPWIKPSNAKYAKRLAREKELMEALIEQLPRYDHFSQRWHFKQSNWLPFYWQGFSQTTRYTYRIEDLGDLDEIWAALQEKTRNEIRKARNRAQLVVRTDLSIDEFYALNTLVFKRQGQKSPYAKTLVENLESAAAERKCSRLFIAEDSNGRRHAGAFLVWDDESAYYLMGGSDPELRNSGATSLCIWEAIEFAASVSKSFDFEGSMLESVERFFRSFGAVQTPYHSIYKTPSRIIRTAKALKSVLL